MAQSSASRSSPAARLDVAARIVAAIPANYGLTSLAVACLARILPMERAEATITATLLSFALFAVIALVAFSVRSSARLWLVMAGAALLLGGGLWLSFSTGGRA